MKIGVVGGGISGLSCLWTLRDSDHNVHLYESSSQLGGHADTNQYVLDGEAISLDTGFIVLQKSTYSNFMAMLEDLSIRLKPTDMSVGFSRDNGRFEWGSSSFSSFFTSLSAFLSPSVWGMLFDLARFNRTAYDALRSTPAFQDPSFSIGDFLRDQGYSQRFVDDLLIPMVAAPWCTDPDFFKAHFPAAKLIPFMHQHGLLSTHTHSLNWHTIEGGSRSYVDAFTRSSPPQHEFHLDSNVVSVKRTDDGKVRLVLSSGEAEVFDHVILAVHANQALRLLGENASTFERETLSSFEVSTNTCVLHSDPTLLPRNPKAWSAWNVMMRSTSDPHPTGKPPATHPTRQSTISLTFDMHKLQHAPLSRAGARPLVSMNPLHPPDPRTVQGVFTYAHPLFTAASVRAEPDLAVLNASGGALSFAGAWMGFGFHEDGVIAGLRAANALLPPDMQRKVRGVRRVEDGKGIAGESSGWSGWAVGAQLRSLGGNTVRKAGQGMLGVFASVSVVMLACTMLSSQSLL